MSMPPPGGSILITSAPMPARVAPPSGAATKAESSITRSPARIGWFKAMSRMPCSHEVGMRFQTWMIPVWHAAGGVRIELADGRLLEAGPADHDEGGAETVTGQPLAS